MSTENLESHLERKSTNTARRQHKLENIRKRSDVTKWWRLEGYFPIHASWLNELD